MKHNTFNEGTAVMLALAKIQCGALERNDSTTPVADTFAESRELLATDISTETFIGIVRLAAEIEIAASAARVRSASLDRLEMALNKSPTELASGLTGQPKKRRGNGCRTK